MPGQETGNYGAFLLSTCSAAGTVRPSWARLGGQALGSDGPRGNASHATSSLTISEQVSPLFEPLASL